MGRVISYPEKTGVEEGDFILMDSGTAGTKKIKPSNLVKIDATPTQNSANAVSSGGVFTTLQETGDRIDFLTNSALKITDNIIDLTLDLTKWKQGYPGGSQAYAINLDKKIAISAGEIIYGKINSATLEKAVKLFVYAYDANDAKLGEKMVGQSTGYGNSYTLPENTTYIYAILTTSDNNYPITPQSVSAMGLEIYCGKTNITSIYTKYQSVVPKVEQTKQDVTALNGKVESISEAISNIGITEKLSTVGELIKAKVLSVEAIEVKDATSVLVRSTQIFDSVYSGITATYGITMTKNTDGSYTIDGTATSSAWFYLNQSTRTGSDNLLSLDGTYTLSLEEISGSLTGSIIAVIRDRNNNTTLLQVSNSIPQKYGIIDNDHVVIGIQIQSGTVYSAYTFRIMCNKGREFMPWAKYKTPQTVTSFENLKYVVNEYSPDIWISTTPETAEINANLNVIPNLNTSELAEKITNLTLYKNNNIICANHRGYHNGYPENTLWAFAQSKARGFEWIENDVRMTSDGVGVLLHDPTINRTARNMDGTAISGDVNIADITYTQACEYDFGIYMGTAFAGTKIVTVEECLAFCKNVGLKILMEPKPSGAGTYCANLVKKYAMEDSVIWIAFSASVLQEVSAVLPDAKIGYVTTETPSSSHVATAVGLKTDNNSVFIDFDYTKSIDDVVDSMIQNDIGYAVYTLNDASALDDLDPYCFMITSDTLLSNRQLARDSLDEWL